VDNDHVTEDPTSNITTLASVIGSELFGFHAQHDGHSHGDSVVNSTQVSIASKILK
jgi:hypothetical protein